MANVGDSRAVLAQRRDGADGAEVTTDGHRMRALDLSMDQNANDPKERERIVGLGGYITTPEDKTLSPRVWLDQRCTLVGLAMSRSIGDHALESVGVIAEPVIVEHDLKRGDQVSFYVNCHDLPLSSVKYYVLFGFCCRIRIII